MIHVWDLEAIQVRREGDKTEVRLIAHDGQERIVAVEMEPPASVRRTGSELPAVPAARAA
jgi:hypothetical protein